MLGFTDNTFTLEITSSGEGTIGSYEEVAIVTFTHLGGTTWRFDGETTIFLLDEDGDRTGDKIYTTDSGIFANGRNEGSFRIVGGTGLYDGATGSGAFHFLFPTGTYTGVIRLWWMKKQAAGEASPRSRILTGPASPGRSFCAPAGMVLIVRQTDW